MFVLFSTGAQKCNNDVRHYNIFSTQITLTACSLLINTGKCKVPMLKGFQSLGPNTQSSPYLHMVEPTQVPASPTGALHSKWVNLHKPGHRTDPFAISFAGSRDSP